MSLWSLLSGASKSTGAPRATRASKSTGASPARLARHVRKLEGERHPRTSPDALKKAGRYIARELEGLGLDVSSEPFEFRGEMYENIIGRKWGRSERPGWGRTMGRTKGRRGGPLLRLAADGSILPQVRIEDPVTGRIARHFRGNGRSRGGSRNGRSRRSSRNGQKDALPPSPPRVLIGAHYDTIPGTPGADDNASGVAGMLEAARILSRESFDATIEFAAFTLEELQTYTYRVGSRRHADGSRRNRVRYAGALILEMIGYRSTEPGSQRVPRLIAWKDIPRTGDFLAIAGDGQSAKLLRLFRRTAAEAVPDLPVIAHRSPLRGWLVWATRLSDNASFWSSGYPSLMITDTAFLRNPNYHRTSDTHETLDFDFMAEVTDATVATAAELAGGAGSGGSGRGSKGARGARDPGGAWDAGRAGRKRGGAGPRGKRDRARTGVVEP